MAYSPTQWEKAKGFYEAGMTLSQINERVGISKSKISEKAKREKWEHGKNTEYIEHKQKVIEQKGNILEHSGTIALEIADTIAIDKAKMNIFFQNSHIKNQHLNNKRLEVLEELSKENQEILLDKDATKIIDYHAATTLKNKEGVLGKDPETVINNANLQQNELIIEII